MDRRALASKSMMMPDNTMRRINRRYPPPTSHISNSPLAATHSYSYVRSASQPRSTRASTPRTNATANYHNSGPPRSPSLTHHVAPDHQPASPPETTLTHPDLSITPTTPPPPTLPRAYHVFILTHSPSCPPPIFTPKSTPP
jgi:hypothetical protein